MGKCRRLAVVATSVWCKFAKFVGSARRARFHASGKWRRGLRMCSRPAWGSHHQTTLLRGSRTVTRRKPRKSVVLSSRWTQATRSLSKHSQLPRIPTARGVTFFSSHFDTRVLDILLAHIFHFALLPLRFVVSSEFAPIMTLMIVRPSRGSCAPTHFKRLSTGAFDA